MKTQDNFVNLAANLGLGADNLASSASYNFSPTTRNRMLLEFIYRSSWIGGAVVDIPAEDATRTGCNILGNILPNKIDTIEREAIRLNIWGELCNLIKWSRLYGGAVGVLLIDGEDPELPLDIESIRPSSFKGIFPLDRWVLLPELWNPIKELGPSLGMPSYYNVVADAQALVQARIHYTRVIRVDGIDLPYWQRMTENMWGESVIERLYDRLQAFDSITQGAAQLTYRAHLRVVAIDGFRELAAAGGDMLKALTSQIDTMRRFQSNEGVSIIDAKDRFEANSYSFGGLSDILSEVAQQISGSTQIPLSRLFGQSPRGFSTGETDIRNYYDLIESQRNKRLLTGINIIYQLIYRSLFNSAPPDDFAVRFKPLWQTSDIERANIATANTNAVIQAFEVGLVSRADALKELQQSSDVTGLWSNVDINYAPETAPNNEPS